MLTKDEIAQDLVNWHFEVEPEITEVYRFLAQDENNRREPIKLLEVSEATLAAGRVIPFGFGSTSEVPYPCIIANVTPEEMTQILQGAIPLPEGWDISHSQHYPAPVTRKSYTRKSYPYKIHSGKKAGQWRKLAATVS